MRIFIDTNVLFDIIAQREPFVEESRKVIMMQMFGDAELWAAPQSFLDVFYVLRKQAPAAQVQEAIVNLLERVNVCSTGHGDVRTAAQAGWGDLEVALIGACCKKCSADALLTRDESAFTQLGMPVMSPADFFAWLEREQGIVYEEMGLAG